MDYRVLQAILGQGFKEKNITFRRARFQDRDLCSYTMHNWNRQQLHDKKVRDKELAVTG